MDLSFLFEDSEFIAFGAQHWYPLLIVAVCGCISIVFARKFLNPNQQRIFGTMIALFPAIAVFGRIGFLFFEGSLDLKEELPFHICRFVALLMPFVMWTKNRFWMGVFYFWILVGTLNANITPDVEAGYPNWSYFMYWILHPVLVILPFYYVILYKVQIQWKDFWNAYLYVNVFALFTLVFNFVFDTNYMYTRQKPSSASLIDLMGPWPWYLISLQFLALFLFLLVFLPFLIKRRFSSGST